MLDLLLFLAAWLGHACLWMVLLNVVYAQPWHKQLLKKFRLVIGLMIWFGPPLFAWFYGTDVLGLIRSAGASGENLLPAAYLLVCLGIALVGLPFVTLLRLLGGRPEVVADEQTETVDVAKELGGRPVGEGKQSWVAKLPINQLFRVDFTRLALRLPDLPPAWDGLSILHLSDLHFRGVPAFDYYEWVIERCLAHEPPDLLVVTGDLVDTETHHEWIGPLLGRLRWNVAALAILGNHDYWQRPEQVRESLRQTGFRVVGNSWEKIEVRGEPLVVIGNETPWFRPGPDLSELPAEGFRLCLSHTPDNIGWARRHGVRLMLSGHNHGGQIRLPLFGSIFVPSRFSRRYDCGTYHEAPTVLHVNRGLSGKEPLRIRCNPQVTRIVLSAECGERNAE